MWTSKVYILRKIFAIAEHKVTGLRMQLEKSGFKNGIKWSCISYGFGPIKCIVNGDSKYFEFTTKISLYGEEGGRKAQEEEIYVNILLICFTVQQKLAQHY